MEVKDVDIKEDFVSMTFIPQNYDDIVMAETIFGNIVGEQYGQEIFEPFPYEKSTFSEEEVLRMISSSETKFFYNDERGFVLTTKKEI